MVSLYPAATASFDTALAARLAPLPQPAASQGVDIGKQVAQAVIQWRTGDGSAGPDPAYTNAPLPGLWRPTAPGQVAAGTRFATILPFGLLTPTQFLPAPPPQLDTAEYAQNYQQVMDVGRVDSVTRTAEQTQLARLIAGVSVRPGPFALWNQVTRGLAESRQMSLLETARMFALMNVSMHDGLQTSHTSKYIYHLWRPVTAIPNAADDLNPATMPDLDLDAADHDAALPVPFKQCGVHRNQRSARPRAGAGQQCNSLQRDLDVDRGTGCRQRCHPLLRSLSQLADEAGMARVYGGIHFEFEIHASNMACTKVADYVFSNYLGLR